MLRRTAPLLPPTAPGIRAVFARRVRTLPFWSILALAAMHLGALPSRATPFTYQGRLVDGGTLANGNYDITFRLFDAATAGTQTGPDLIKSPVIVQNGLFTLDLDFGDAVFDGAARWLELSARPTGSSDPAELLSPRQPVHAVPYAIRALSGSGNNASDLTSGTVPDARLAPTIARSADLLTVSNSLATLWNDLSLRITTLNSSLLAISNAAQSTIPSGINVVSIDPADPGLLGQGMVRFLSIPATPWIHGPSGGPTARSAHSAVWTGDSLLVWGGATAGANLSSLGFRYDLTFDQWFPLSEIDTPSARRGHSAIWTGQSMVVWGGFGSTFLGSGAAYSLSNATWSLVPTLNAPAGRDEHVAVWTGARMVVWGGRNANGLLDNGGLYDPVAKAWTPLAPSPAIEARQDAVGLWTGSQFLVWGGLGTSGALGTGARLPFTAGAIPGAWSAMEPSGAPSARVGHTAVWTGTRMIVWGGNTGSTFHGNGSAYDPTLNSWTPLPATGAPSPRSGHVAAWTGEEMLIVGGQTAAGEVASGAAYHPGTGTWRPLSGGGSPVARRAATGTWTGTDLLVFGGLQGSSPVAALQRLNPQPTWHFYRKP